MDPNAVRKETYGKSTVLAIIGVLLIIAAIGGVAYIFANNPDVLNNVLLVIVIIVIAVLVIAVAIAIFAFLIAIPLYARGREIQTDMSYDLDDVKEVDGKTLDDPKQ